MLQKWKTLYLLSFQPGQERTLQPITTPLTAQLPRHDGAEQSHHNTEGVPQTHTGEREWLADTSQHHGEEHSQLSTEGLVCFQVHACGHLGPLHAVQRTMNELSCLSGKFLLLVWIGNRVLLLLREELWPK